MRHRSLIAAAILTAAAGILAPLTLAQTTGTQPDATAPATIVPETFPAPKPDTAEHAARIGWWREAHFGMMIHWGLYSVPAGTWKGEKVAGIGEWIMNHAKIPVREYEALAKDFNPTKFDADAWAQLAQDAGMRYMVITSKHHDGFAMFASKVSAYNIVDATPFKRDPMKELAAACAKRNIKFCFYYSQAQDWHEPGGMGNNWDFPSNEEKDTTGAYDKYLQEKAEPQVREILSNYGPIGLVWFDTPLLMTRTRAARFEKIVHDLQPNCLVSGRIGQGSVADYDSEGDNHYPGIVRPGDWEVPATLNDTWGFKSYDENWKKADDLVFKLCDVVSKGGNYLLNVGPDSTGTIPQPSQDMLHTVGQWMKLNSEAIYGAKPTPFGVELGTPTAAKDKRGRTIYDMKKDWRCTTKNGKLYFIIFNWPKDGIFKTPPMKQTITSAYLLTDPKMTPLKVTRAEDKSLTLTLPTPAPNPIAGVVVVQVD